MSGINKHKLDRKKLILQKAAFIFKEKGFAASSMRNLANDVGIEAASLYNHINSKHEILEGICFDVANMFTNQIEEIENSQNTPIQKIELLIRFHIQQMINNYEEVYVSDKEWKHLNEPFLTNFQNQRKNYRKKFSYILEQSIKKNEIREIDAPTAVLIILHAISGIESWHRSQTKITAEELENNMVYIMINGLKKSS